MRPHVDGLRARGIGGARHRPARAQGGDRAGGVSRGGRAARPAGSSAAIPTAVAWPACSRRPTGRGPRAWCCFSYPLHRPGAAGPRGAHGPLAGIRCPVLFLSGESDPFARIDLLRGAVADLLPSAQLVTWPRLGHSLAPVLDEALDRVAAFVRAGFDDGLTRQASSDAAPGSPPRCPPTGSTWTRVSGASSAASRANVCGGSTRVDGLSHLRPTGWSVPQWMGTATRRSQQLERPRGAQRVEVLVRLRARAPAPDRHQRQVDALAPGRPCRRTGRCRPGSRPCRRRGAGSRWRGRSGRWAARSRDAPPPSPRAAARPSARRVARRQLLHVAEAACAQPRPHAGGHEHRHVLARRAAASRSPGGPSGSAR